MKKLHPGYLIVGILGIATLLIMPFLLILIIPLSLMGIVIYGIIDGLINKRGRLFYASISIVLTMITSHLHYLITQPCHDIQMMCDYYYGFPLPIWLVNDYIHPIFAVIGLGGLLLDTLLWYILLKLARRNFHTG